MSNDNDTIEQVCADLRGHDLIPPPHGAWVIYANRIRDVYDRERRAWDAAIVDQRSVNKKLAGELASKDAEIARLKDEIKCKAQNYEDVIRAKDQELARLRAGNKREEYKDFLYR